MHERESLLQVTVRCLEGRLIAAANVEAAGRVSQEQCHGVCIGRRRQFGGQARLLGRGGSRTLIPASQCPLQPRNTISLRAISVKRGLSHRVHSGPQ